MLTCLPSYRCFKVDSAFVFAISKAAEEEWKEDRWNTNDVAMYIQTAENVTLAQIIFFIFMLFECN